LAALSGAVNLANWGSGAVVRGLSLAAASLCTGVRMDGGWAECCGLAAAVLSRSWVRALLDALPLVTLAALYAMVADEWEA